MKYLVLFIVLTCSMIVNASTIQPKLFAKLGTPLYDSSEIFIEFKKFPSLSLLVDEYILEAKTTLNIGTKADLSNNKEIKNSYLKSLRLLQKKHDKIVALSTRELKLSMKENNYEKFLNLVNISMIYYLERKSLRKMIITYYSENKAKGRSSILDTIIYNEMETEIIYYEKDEPNKRECYYAGNIWDVDTCRKVTYGRVKEEFGIEIIGNESFTRQLTKAMYLLKYKSFDNFLFVKKYLGRIKQTKIADGRRGMSVRENPPTWYANNVSVMPSLKWCAGVLVHEANHSYLYSSYKKKYKTNRVPLNVYGEANGELSCNKKQADAMKDIGSSKRKIEWLLSQDGKHGDMDGDGKHYTKKDKALRAKLDLERAKKLNITDDM